MAVYFLFDIDGVLVQPMGYRHALQSTLAYYFQQMGLPAGFLPDEDEIGFFEANRITSEWDMIPICLAAVFNQALPADLPPIETIAQALAWVKTNQPVLDRPNYRRWISDCARLHDHQSALADILFVALKFNHDYSPFRHLSDHPFAEALLNNSRDFMKNEVSRTFQNHVLGEDIFRDYYPRLPSLPVRSSLLEFDRPLIPQSEQQKLKSLLQSGKIKAAAMTLRPNHYSNYATNGRGSLAGYSPEADIAIRLTGMEPLPVAGYGTLLYLAQKHDLSVDHIVKPSALHALVGLFLAARNSPEMVDEALRWFIKLSNPLKPPSTTPVNIPVFGKGRFQVHVFEDSPNGILAAIQATELLKCAGCAVELHAWGISSHPDKRSALMNLGAVVTTTTEQALHRAYQKLSN
ncbi:MAG: hypothetical protein AB1453_07770 [Chloroflexota bacterium]